MSENIGTIISARGRECNSEQFAERSYFPRNLAVAYSKAASTDLVRSYVRSKIAPRVRIIEQPIPARDSTLIVIVIAETVHLSSP